MKGSRQGLPDHLQHNATRSSVLTLGGNDGRGWAAAAGGGGGRGGQDGGSASRVMTAVPAGYQSRLPSLSAVLVVILVAIRSPLREPGPVPGPGPTDGWVAGAWLAAEWTDGTNYGRECIRACLPQIGHLRST